MPTTPDPVVNHGGSPDPAPTPAPVTPTPAGSPRSMLVPALMAALVVMGLTLGWCLMHQPVAATPPTTTIIKSPTDAVHAVQTEHFEAQTRYGRASLEVPVVRGLNAEGEARVRMSWTGGLLEATDGTEQKTPPVKTRPTTRPATRPTAGDPCVIGGKWVCQPDAK